MALRQALARLAGAQIRLGSGLIPSSANAILVAEPCAKSAFEPVSVLAQSSEIRLASIAGPWRSFSADSKPPEDSAGAPPAEAEAVPAEEATGDASAGAPVQAETRLTPRAGDPATSATGERGVMLSEDMFMPLFVGRGKHSGLNEMVKDLDEYLDTLPELPKDIPIYDLPTVMGERAMVDTEVLDQMMESLEQHPEMKEMFEGDGEDPAPYPGARKILHWRQHGVLLSVYGSENTHPINKKAECTVHMKELQDELALSDDAVKHIIAVCGPRYKASTGMLRLVSEKYADREDNRRYIVEQIHALAEEGRRLFPNPTAAQDLAAYREQCRVEAEELGKKVATASA